MSPAVPMPSTGRSDLGFPFRVDPVSQQTMVAAYPAHVDQMVRQLLLTSPGERINLPQFGCGLRSLVFSPLSDTTQATVKLSVMQAFGRWLAGIATLSDLTVATAADGAVLEPGSISVSVTYTLVETQTTNTVTVLFP